MIRHRYNLYLSVAGIALLILVAVGGTLAANGFSVPWWTVDGGGVVSTGGGYTVGGTSGQPDAGQMTGPGFTLNSGFWPGGGSPPPQFRFFLPIVMSQAAHTSSTGLR